MNIRKQQGMTMLGWIIVLAIIGIFAIAGLRIGPMYLEFYKINSVLDAVVEEVGGEGTTKQDIYAYLSKRFDIEAVNVIDAREVKIERKGEFYEVGVDYDARSEFIGNLSFIANFQKAVEVPR